MHLFSASPLSSLTIELCDLLFCLQNVIPQQLLDQYLSMTDPARAQTVDTEIAKHCAFSLPGVALTLGRQNWHCLKDTYETLATDVQVGREKGNNDDNEYLLTVKLFLFFYFLLYSHRVWSHWSRLFNSVVKMWYLMGKAESPVTQQLL